MLKMLDLFSGIGGFSLAANWTGFIETVSFCENDNFCKKVLNKNFPGIPVCPEIKELKGDDIGSIDIISGGDPCQPHSIAGRRMGMEDERYLWPEMFRVIAETKPDWVINENVAGSISNGVLLKKIYDLESEGFETQPFLIPAYAIGAYDERYRVLIIANSSSKRWTRILCNHKIGFNEKKGKYEAVTLDARGNPFDEFRKRMGEPAIFGMDNGISNRVDRLKCLGNAIKPQLVYPIFQAIVDIEIKTCG